MSMTMTTPDQSFGGDNANPTPDSLGDNKPADNSNEELALYKRRLKDKDDFIETLKGETKELRTKVDELSQQVSQARTIDELMERVKDYNEPSDQSGQTGPRLDEDKLLSKLEERVFGKLTAQQKLSLEEQNWNASVQLLQEKYGDKYTDYVRQRSVDLSVPIEELDRLAKTSPKALLELVAGPQQKSNMQPTTPSQRTPSNSGSKTPDEEYFAKINKLRLTSGSEGAEARKVYNSKEFQKAWRQSIIDKVASK